jgi:superfamily II DNA helicase RecQ
MALTATANKPVVDDIVKRLGMQNCLKLTQSFNRHNLNYNVRPKPGKLLDAIATYIKSNHSGKSGVIYCLSRNSCEELAKNLREKYNISAKHYHAKMSAPDKATTQAEWQSGQCNIIVATVSKSLSKGLIDPQCLLTDRVWYGNRQT